MTKKVREHEFNIFSTNKRARKQSRNQSGIVKIHEREERAPSGKLNAGDEIRSENIKNLKLVL